MTDVLDENLPPMKWSIIIGADADLEILAQKLRLAAAVTSIGEVRLCIHPSQVLAVARAMEWRKSLDAANKQMQDARRDLVVSKADLTAKIKTAVIGSVGYIVMISCVVFTFKFWGWILT